MILFGLGKYPFALPHPFGHLLPKHRIAHPREDFFKQSLIEATQHEALRRRALDLRTVRCLHLRRLLRRLFRLRRYLLRCLCGVLRIV